MEGIIMTTLADLESEFYRQYVDDAPYSSVSDLAFLFYRGVLSGDISLGGGGTVTTEQVQDIIGGMVASNTETGINVVYDDTNGKLNFSVLGGGTITTEEVQDIIGSMVDSNTETGITVNYDDNNGKLDFSVPTSTTLTTEQVQDIVGAMFSGNTETNISADYQDSDGTIDLVITAEIIQDIIGAMVDSNSETGISVTYNDSSGKLDFSVLGGGTVTTEEIQDVIGSMVDGNTESGIIVTYDDTNGKLDFSISSIAPSTHTRYAAISENNTFIASEFTDSTTGSNSQTNTITIPSYTENRYLAFAVPDTQDDLISIKEQGSAFDSFGFFERVTGTINIGGSAHKVWRSTDVLFPPEAGETLIWELN